MTVRPWVHRASMFGLMAGIVTGGMAANQWLLRPGQPAHPPSAAGPRVTTPPPSAQLRPGHTTRPPVAPVTPQPGSGAARLVAAVTPQPGPQVDPSPVPAAAVTSPPPSPAPTTLPPSPSPSASCVVSVLNIRVCLPGQG